MTRCTSVAATVESTPPDSAQMTWSAGPTVAAILAISSSNTFSIFQSAFTRATPNKNRSRVAPPRSEWCTSGWYCKP
jgi:hypothetical protein